MSQGQIHRTSSNKREIPPTSCSSVSMSSVFTSVGCGGVGRLGMSGGTRGGGFGMYLFSTGFSSPGKHTIAKNQWALKQSEISDTKYRNAPAPPFLYRLFFALIHGTATFQV